MNLYEHVFPYGGFRIFDPTDPGRFEERSTLDREFDSNILCTECGTYGLPDGFTHCPHCGSRLGYGIDNAGPARQWYSNRGETEENKDEEANPFYHLHQYDGPANTMEALGDNHRNEQSKDPSHIFGREYLDNPDPESWGERGWSIYLAHVERAKMFRTICDFVKDCNNQKTLNKAYWRFRGLVDKKYANKVENRLFSKFLTTPQIRVVFELFRSKRASLQKGR